MVRAWYMDESESDQRLPHMTDPPRFVNLEQLKEKTGVLYWKINADDFANDATLATIRKDRGYTYEDNIRLTAGAPNYQELIKKFFIEHIHSDEEIRLCLDGSGYFDARDDDDKWIRIEMEKGDMIILPAGIYHRFTLDTQDFIVANRYFTGVPVWTPHNRPADDHPSRKEYVKSRAQVKG